MERQLSDLINHLQHVSIPVTDIIDPDGERLEFNQIL